MHFVFAIERVDGGSTSAADMSLFDPTTALIIDETSGTVPGSTYEPIGHGATMLINGISSFDIMPTHGIIISAHIERMRLRYGYVQINRNAFKSVQT